MITDVMDYCQNHFIGSYEYIEIVFSGSTITAEFDNTYLVGQYVYIKGSTLNDRAYLISSINGDEITLSEAVTTSTESVIIFGCKVPKSFSTLVSDINTWNTEYATRAGLTSERIDDYAATFGSDMQTAGWQGAFSGRLKQFKKLYDDMMTYLEYYA